MSDSPAAFAAKNKAQFAQLEARLNDAGRRFIGDLAARLVETTPGPGLQVAGTEYIATGRLRAGWRWGEDHGEATNWSDGPYTEDGGEIIAEIRASVAGAPVPAISYLWNNVAYAVLVHDGRGRHKEPRPWVDLVALEAPGIGEAATTAAASAT